MAFKNKKIDLFLLLNIIYFALCFDLQVQIQLEAEAYKS